MNTAQARREKTETTRAALDRFENDLRDLIGGEDHYVGIGIAVDVGVLEQLIRLARIGADYEAGVDEVGR